jgi:hypothetical protein
MSEFIAAVASGGDYTQITDHNFIKVLPGDIESVRERLVYALEQLGYRVISEQPLIVKRKRQASSCSFDVLKCIKSLTLGLKSLNPTSTLVTFDYEILSPVVTKGDRQTVEREAEAIMALANSRSVPTLCATCGTNNSADSRFCRVCGTPNVADEPVELEVLRLTAGARAAHQSIVGGAISMLAVLSLALPMIFLSSKGPKGGTILLIVGEILSLLWLFYGIWSLHRTLNPKRGAKQLSLADVQSVSPALLPPQSARASVTEGTTELLVTPERERVAVPSRSKKVDTAEMS